jgi:hypothetical protein
MGWHERHALGSSQGSRGTSRPETLNLEAWIIMLRDNFLTADKQRVNIKETSVFTTTTITLCVCVCVVCCGVSQLLLALFLAARCLPQAKTTPYLDTTTPPSGHHCVQNQGCCYAKITGFYHPRDSNNGFTIHFPNCTCISRLGGPSFRSCPVCKI